MAHHFAIAAALIGIAAIVAVTQYAHASAASKIYEAVQMAHHNGSAPGTFFGTVDLQTGDGATNSGVLLDLGREGCRWSSNSRCEAMIWCIVLLLVIVAVVTHWVKFSSD